MARFAKGMKVRRTFYGTGGYTEENEDVVESVKDGVVRTKECENGITFDATTGRELENFFPGMHQEIVPLAEKGKKEDPCPSCDAEFPDFDGTECKCGYRRRRSPNKAQRTQSAHAEPAVIPPLMPADLANPMFDWQAPKWRRLSGRVAIEWGTFTDGYVKVGCTYFTQTGQLTIVCGQSEHLNSVLYDRPIQTVEEFAKAMKAADRAFRKLVRPT